MQRESVTDLVDQHRLEIGEVRGSGHRHRPVDGGLEMNVTRRSGAGGRGRVRYTGTEGRITRGVENDADLGRAGGFLEREAGRGGPRSEGVSDGAQGRGHAHVVRIVETPT